ncbi:MATE family efflux transporter [Lentisphaerota bacterium ZTH]|nr:MATE family efflux transporter [Lentisphaerota bacterium]WET06839.1 MATE family efflux transporter [Lentisphaerota bacterium ZTH]
MKDIVRIDLTTGSVPGHIIRLTFATMWGFVAMMIFNLTDTYFVSRLGTDYLAAMGFTAPIVMLFGSIGLGFAAGVSSIAARKIGAAQYDKVRNFISDSLIFSGVFATVLGVLGVIFAKPILRLLGADAITLPLAVSYMNVWFWFVAFMVITMVANNAIRATGHASTPAILMIAASLLNVLLDWLLIFGHWGLPRLGLPGAAWATIISRFFALVLSILVLRYQFHLLHLAIPTMRRFYMSVKELLVTAIPACASNLLMPVSNMVLVGLVAIYGNRAVAAFNAGNNILMFTFMIPMAMGSVQMPFAGQNYGANCISRIKHAWKFCNFFGLSYAAVSFVLLYLFGEELASIFSSDSTVVKIIKEYLLILLVTSGFMHISIFTSMVFNAVERPVIAGWINVVRMLVLTIPLAWGGKYILGLEGIFLGSAVANLISGLLCVALFLKIAFKKSGIRPTGQLALEQ